jgi:hypothetical protein
MQIFPGQPKVWKIKSQPGLKFLQIPIPSELRNKRDLPVRKLLWEFSVKLLNT